MDEKKEKDHCLFYYLNPFRKGIAWWKSVLLWLLYMGIIRFVVLFFLGG